jgi:ABC-type dipeptide/oligopeptide/nickel transport system permease subunit
MLFLIQGSGMVKETATVQQSKFLRRFLQNKKTLIGSLLVLLFVFIALFAPFLAVHDPYVMNAKDLFRSPNRTYFFGTDEMGRDVFSRAIYGARISIFVALLVGTMSGLIGIVIGLPSAYLGGKFDLVLQRLVDIVMSFPWILLALLLASILGPSIKTVIFALTIIYAPGAIRVARGKAMSIKEEQHIAAAEAIGERRLAIIFRYIFPNCIGPIIVQTTLIMSWSVLGEAGISYLGFGTQPPTPSWGLMLADATDFIYSAPITLSIFPGLLMLILVFGLNFLGDGLRDLLDPKFRRL